MGGEEAAPVDVRSVTRGGGSDWALAVVIAAVILSVILIATEVVFGSVESYPAFLSGLVAVAAIGLAGWWRARRLLPGLEPLRAQVATGRLDAVVRCSRGTGAVLLSWRNERLRIERGWVVLDGLTREVWPVSAVELGSRTPNWWSGRSIELLTPSGPRTVSLVPTGDTATFCFPLVDNPARSLVAEVLTRQQRLHPRPPAAWYADPWAMSAWRWWDGDDWTGATA